MSATSRSTCGGPRSPTRGRREAASTLGELRRSRDVTQVQLARELAVTQASVSKFEKSNPTVSTVRRYVEALGGQLEITAVFGDERVRLDC